MSADPDNHYAVEEWVGYPMLICPEHMGGEPWPCDVELARLRARVTDSADRET